MINLIPKEEKKRMIASFYFRLALLFFLMLDFSLAMALLGLTPSYFLSITKSVSSAEKLETQKNEALPSFDQETLLVMGDIDTKLDLVEKAEQSKFLISERIINAVALQAGPGTKITRIFYEKDPLAGAKVSIRGTAPSRESLLLFRKALEDTPAFQNVDFPISNFVKGSNIQFYLNLIPRP